MNTLVTVESLRRAGYRVRVLHNRFCPNVEEKFEGYQHFTKFEYNELAKENKLLSWFINDNDEYITPQFNQAISPLNGFTKVEVTTPDGELLVGKCSFTNKPYNKKEGVKIALQKALFGKKAV